MSKRLIGRLLALFGLYALVLAAIGTKFSGKDASGTTGVVELVAVTLAFVAASVLILVRRPREPIE